MLRKPQNVGEWSLLFHEIYGDANAGKHWWEFSARLSTHVCLVASPKYFDGIGDFGWQFSKSVAWLIGIHNQLAKPFGEKTFGASSHPGVLLLNEFPLTCPYCGKKECDLTPPELHSSGHRRDRRNRNVLTAGKIIADDPSAKDFTLHKWGEQILAIYPLDQQRSLPDLSGKVAEEFGELTNALLTYRRGKTSSTRLQQDYFEEFADLFSRLCAFGVRVLKTGAANGDFETIDDMVWEIYERGCPTCSSGHPQSSPCDCHRKEKPEEQAKQLDLQAYYGPYQTVPPISIDIDVTAQAEARSFSGSYSESSLQLHKLALEDRAHDPEIQRIVLELLVRLQPNVLQQQTLEKTAVESLVGQIKKLAPRDRLSRYMSTLKAFLMALAANLGASEVANWLRQLGNNLSNL